MAQAATKDESATKTKRKGFMKLIARKDKIKTEKTEESKEAKHKNKDFKKIIEEKERIKTEKTEESKEAKHKNKDFKKIIEEKERQIEELKDENTALKENVQIQKDSIQSMVEKSKSDTDLLPNKMAELEKQVAELKDAYEGEVSKSKAQMKQIVNLEQEREELLNRFSQFAGERLRHENTDITDLADVDRPAKLAEAYSELYDNEWTDAFEELRNSGLTEHDAIGKLLDILLVSFHNCRQITWERFQTLKSIASSIDIMYSRTDEEESAEPHTSTTTLSINQEKQISDIWLATTQELKNEAVQHLYTVLSSSNGLSIKTMARTSKYLTGCIDLCWKMGVQEKPLHLDSVAEKCDGSGKKFDLDKFKAFTQAGERVAFVVWPALCLHENGPILVRGIAQGCNNLKSEIT